MLRRCSLLVIVLAILPAAGAQPVPGLQGLGDTRFHQLDSGILDHGLHVIVGLPDGYDANAGATYPAVYLLDGGELYPMLAAYYRYLRWGKEVPDLVLIGISYGSSDFESGNRRSHDYTAPSAQREFWGGAEDFLDFLGTELIPFIEERYRTDPAKRVLFGQSLGGQFVLYTAQTDARIFWGHIASNPALHRNLEYFLDRRPVTGASRSRLFVGAGSEDETQFRDPLERWEAAWSQPGKAPWDLAIRPLPGHSHFSAPPAAFRDGLRWLFSVDPGNR